MEGTARVRVPQKWKAGNPLSKPALVALANVANSSLPRQTRWAPFCGGVPFASHMECQVLREEKLPPPCAARKTQTMDTFPSACLPAKTPLPPSCWRTASFVLHSHKHFSFQQRSKKSFLLLLVLVVVVRQKQKNIHPTQQQHTPGGQECKTLNCSTLMPT